jgi:polygalacturonase
VSNVDSTGATLMTSKIQSAINAASGATQNILFFPPGKYLIGEVALKSNMTLYVTVQGKAITSQTDADATWSINSFVSNITFQ